MWGLNLINHVADISGKPDAPRNCVLTNRTTRSLQVTCVRGFDGGMQQQFTLELYSATTLGGDEKRRLISNVTSRTKPEFIVTGLEPGVGYFLTVYSTNDKGRSGDVSINVRVTHVFVDLKSQPNTIIRNEESTHKYGKEKF